jgi:hypothetical protein
MARVRSLVGVVGRLIQGVLDALWRALSSDPEDSPWERAAVRIVVPFAFLSAGLIASLVAYRTDRPPAAAFENRLIFAGELLLLAFYGVLLVLVPLVRALTAGELPIEMTARGARFSDRTSEGSLASDQVLTERIESLEAALAEQELESERRAYQATEGMADFAGDLTALRARFDEIERRVR